MGVPAIVGDIGGPYVPPQPTQPPLTATIISGSTTVLIKGAFVATFLTPTQTTLGAILSSTLNSTITLIQGSPVILGGSVTNLSSGYTAGVILAVGAVGVIVN